MLCKICTVQIQPRNLRLDHADYTAPTRPHELDPTDHTDHTDHTDQEYLICPERSRSLSVGIDRTDHALSGVCTVPKVSKVSMYGDMKYRNTLSNLRYDSYGVIAFCPPSLASMSVFFFMVTLVLNAVFFVLRCVRVHRHHS